MRGIGCITCGGSKKKTTEQFIIEAKEIFPLFDYSKIEYVTALKKVIIGCPIHGDFLQTPNAILNNVGCAGCGVERQQRTKIERGIVADPATKTEYENYRRAVWRYTNRNYKEYKSTINPTGLERNLKNHLDHKYSIQQGWLNNVPAEIIGGYKNLQILEGIANRRKGNKCDITLEEI